MGFKILGGGGPRSDTRGWMIHGRSRPWPRRPFSAAKSDARMATPGVHRPVLSRPWVIATVTAVFVTMPNTSAAVLLRPLERDIAKTPSVMFSYFLLVFVLHLARRLYRDPEGPAAVGRGVYWSVVSPVVRLPGRRMALIAAVTTVIVFAPAYVPVGPFSFNIVL